jgi:hypothetical protein
MAALASAMEAASGVDVGKPAAEGRWRLAVVGAGALVSRGGLGSTCVVALAAASRVVGNPLAWAVACWAWAGCQPGRTLVGVQHRLDLLPCWRGDPLQVLLVLLLGLVVSRGQLAQQHQDRLQ